MTATIGYLYHNQANSEGQKKKYLQIVSLSRDQDWTVEMSWKIKKLFLSFQTSLRAMMDSSGAIMLSVFPPDGDVMAIR